MIDEATSISRRFRERSDILETHYSKRRSLVVLSILLLSLADAFFTLNIIEKGGAELNPIMELAITHGVTFFLFLKYLCTSLGLLVLCTLGYKKIAKGALIYFLLFYLTLTLFHIDFFLGS